MKNTVTQLFILQLLFAICIPVVLIAQNVGIGTAAPGSKLHIITNSGSVPLRIQNTLSSSYTGIHFHSSDGPLMGHVGFANAAAPTLSNQFYAGSIAAVPFVFTTSDQERMRISFSGEVGIGTNNPSVFAALDITSDSKGLLIPRLTTAQRNALAGAPEGLMVYDSSSHVFYYNNGVEWQNVLTATQAWGMGGNSGTNPAVNFIGTLDNKPLRFRINNFPAGLIDSSSLNTFFGYSTGAAVSTGTKNVAIGAFALYANTTGIGNTATGTNALQKNEYGTENTANGNSALYQNVSGIQNTAAGSYALYSNVSGNQNTVAGTYALYSNSSGSYNTAAGATSLTYNTTGIYNTADGFHAMVANTTGAYNTAAGARALFTTTASQYNTAVGYNAGDSYDMGYNNTILGANCDVNAAGMFNCIAIGQAVVATASSQARIGNSATNSIGGYAGWTNFSDGRFKKDIKSNVKGIEFIMKLNPVTYHLDVSGISNAVGEYKGREMDAYSKQATAEKEKIIYTGFVAQEVEKAAMETGYDFSGVDKPKNEKDFYGLRYAEFVVPLVKAVQEQQLQLNELKKEIDQLKEQNKLLLQLLKNKN